MRGITFVAFTATPKNKTMELFGTRPDPTRKPAPDNLPQPFHVYSMRQAIEEKFILDVLQNYTPYKLAFKLAHEGKDYDEKKVERSAAMKGIMGWVRLHPYNIAQKVQIVVEHFREFVAPLPGRAAADDRKSTRVPESPRADRHYESPIEAPPDRLTASESELRRALPGYRKTGNGTHHARATSPSPLDRASAVSSADPSA